MGRTVQRSLEDNPIAFGAAALLAGVAIALALPATRQERQLLGDAHDQFMDKAQDVCRQCDGGSEAGGESKCSLACRRRRSVLWTT